MKHLIALALVALSVSAHAGYNSPEALDCVKQTVQLKEVLSGAKYDSAITPMLNAFPQYRAQLEQDVQNPYRCSGK